MQDRQIKPCLFRDKELQIALSDVGVYATNYKTGQTFPSDLWRELEHHFKVGPENEEYLDLVHPDDRMRLRDSLERVFSGERSEFAETYRLMRTDGSYRWVRSRGRAVTTSNGKPELFIGSDSDVSDFKEAEGRLREIAELERKRRTEVETLREVVGMIGSSLDTEETVRRILDETRRVIAYETGTVQILDGSHLEVIGGAGFDDIDMIIGLRFPYPEPGSLSTIAIQQKRPILSNDIGEDFPAFIQPNPDHPIQSWIGIPLIRGGEVIGLMALDSFETGVYTPHDLEIADIIAGHVAIALENARLHEKAYELAMIDALTGVGSRHRFQLEGRLIFESAKRTDRGVAVAILDLDHFKAVNDTYGHDAGDLVLKRIAGTCHEETRATDLFARYGGEEFIFVLGDADSETVMTVLERIRSRLERLVHPETNGNVTVSIGVTLGVPAISDQLSEFVTRADTALYASKKNGRNRITVYDQDLS